MIFIIIYLNVFYLSTGLAKVGDDISESSHVKCATSCFNNGKCRAVDSCLCLPGFTGYRCEYCDGRIRLTDRSGTISSNYVGNYTDDMRCSWLIDGSQLSPPAKSIRFRLDQFSTECGWDHLYIYSGSNPYSEQIVSLSGTYSDYRSNNSVNSFTDILVQSPIVFVYFFSDTAVEVGGFNLSYAFDACPYDCSNHGKCNSLTTKCECSEGFTGLSCQIDDCQHCQGSCNKKSMKCECPAGRRGTNCDLTTADEAWTVESEPHSGEFSPRAGHASVVVDDEAIHIGGVPLDGGRILQSFVKFSFGTKKWTTVENCTGLKCPSARYDHSLVANGHKIYMFGGKTMNGDISDELFEYNTKVKNSWEKLISATKPLAVAGHSAVLINRTKLYILMGYSPILGYLDQVQIFDLVTKNWTIVAQAGQLIHATFGHRSIYDPVRRMIISFGGYYDKLFSEGAATNQLIGFHVTEQRWFILPSLEQARFMHSAVTIGGLMLVHSGCTPSAGDQSDCYSTSAVAYDPECQSWFKLKFPLELPSSAAARRFSHSALVYNESMYIFGGYNGRMLSTVLRYQPAECSGIKNKTDCFAFRKGRRCEWAPTGCVNFGSTNRLSSSYNKGDETKVVEVTQECGDLKSTISKPLTCADFRESVVKAGEDKTFVSARSCVSPNAVGLNCVYCGDTDCRSIERCPKNTKGNIITSMADITSNRDYVACFRKTVCLACTGSCAWLAKIENATNGECRADGSPLVEQVATLEKSSLEKLDISAIADRPDSKQPTLKGKTECTKSCFVLDNCASCAANKCLWCASAGRCLDINVYIPSFLYGQCTSWMTQITADRCEDARPCEAYNQCDECMNRGPLCGWCDDGSDTGRGKCMSGTHSGPIKVTPMVGTATPPPTLNDTLGDDSIMDLLSVVKLQENTCPSESWYYFKCPTCRCNGHATCLNTTQSSLVAYSSYQQTCETCGDFTAGLHCGTCKDNYYGVALNGGTCEECTCNGHAVRCDGITGDCYCNTRGIVGRNCDECEIGNDPTNAQYVGDAINDTCYYNLTVDYVFTFQFNEDKDKNYTKINFISRPQKSGTDVTFKISCTRLAGQFEKYYQPPQVTLKLESGYLPEKSKILLQGMQCGDIQRTWPTKDLGLGPEYNATFYVYVSDFRMPFEMHISFAQSPEIDWVKFFITFASCFLSLLLVAAVLWKVKLRIDAYRRRQRMFIEMAQMASRPVATISLEFQSEHNLLKQNATPLSIEPCADYRAAVISVAVRLPTGGRKYAPSGQSGLAVANALVTMSPSYLAQLQTPPSPEPEQKAKRRRPRCIS